MARAAKEEVLVSLCRQHLEWDGHHAARLVEVLGLMCQHIDLLECVQKDYNILGVVISCPRRILRS